jgi:hypothetical protein
MGCWAIGGLRLGRIPVHKGRLEDDVQAGFAGDFFFLSLGPLHEFHCRRWDITGDQEGALTICAGDPLTELLGKDLVGHPPAKEVSAYPVLIHDRLLAKITGEQIVYHRELFPAQLFCFGHIEYPKSNIKMQS